MKITDQAIDEFMALWEETYGERLEADDAREYAVQLLQLLQAVYGGR